MRERETGKAHVEEMMRWSLDEESARLSGGDTPGKGTEQIVAQKLDNFCNFGRIHLYHPFNKTIL